MTKENFNSTHTHRKTERGKGKGREGGRDRDRETSFGKYDMRHQFQLIDQVTSLLLFLLSIFSSFIDLNVYLWHQEHVI